MTAHWLMLAVLLCSCATTGETRQAANDLTAFSNALANEIDLVREVIVQRCSGTPTPECVAALQAHRAAVAAQWAAMDAIDVLDKTGHGADAAARAIDDVRVALQAVHDALAEVPHG